MIDSERRALMMGAAGSAVGLGLVGMPGYARAVVPATTTGWTYVAPGGSIQAAITSGAKAIQLGAGEYRLTQPLIMDNGVTLQGVGQTTRLIATSSFPKNNALIEIGAGGPIDGVSVFGLALDCDGIAACGIRCNIVGTAGNYQGEPDAICRFDNLWIYDAAEDGMVYMGVDTQATISTRIRVRRAKRHGFNILNSDNWFTECEATTSGSEGAGFYITGGNSFFTACKAWYCRGHGFYAKGPRNKFVACEAQDIAKHGFYLLGGFNVFTACVADSCSSERAGGSGGTHDGFYLEWDGEDNSIIGCQAFDKKKAASLPISAMDSM